MKIIKNNNRGVFPPLHYMPINIIFLVRQRNGSESNFHITRGTIGFG
jgi:hypothetical protein